MTIQVINPYINQLCITRVPIYSHQIDNNLLIHIKNNLKNKVEGQHTEYGYICKIYNIHNYGEGIIYTENLEAIPIFNIKYSAKICNPVVNSLIIIKISNIDDNTIKGYNGPIINLSYLYDVNKIKFQKNMDNIIHINSRNGLKVGDYIKILITYIKNRGKNIFITSKIYDIAKEDEIKDYFITNNDI